MAFPLTARAEAVCTRRAQALTRQYEARGVGMRRHVNTLEELTLYISQHTAAILINTYTRRRGSPARRHHSTCIALALHYTSAYSCGCPLAVLTLIDSVCVLLCTVARLQPGSST